MLGSEHLHAVDIGSEKLHALQELWAELAMFPVWDSTAALRCFLSGLCDVFDGCDASWMVLRKQSKLPRGISSDHYKTIFESMRGWSPVAAEYLDPDKTLKKVADRWLMHARREGLDPVSESMMQGVGKYARACIRHDVATDQEWADHWISRRFHEFYGVGERIIAASPINHKCETYIIIDRPIGSEPYTIQDRELIAYAQAGVPIMLKRLCLERGLLGSSSLLSNRETDTYRLLLTNLSEGEIAEKLNLSTHTIHDYARKLYRKFGVKGRVGLMAMVLEV